MDIQNHLYHLLQASVIELKYHNSAISLAILIRKLRQAVFELRNWQDQPRVPAGNEDGGQWMNYPTSARIPNRSPVPVAIAPTLFGRLVHKLRAPGAVAVNCIYDFGDALYTWSSNIFEGCPGILHQSAVVPRAGGRGNPMNDN